MSNTEQDLSASEVEFGIKLAEDPVFFMENILRNPEDPDKNFSFKDEDGERTYQAEIVRHRPVYVGKDSLGKPIYKNRSRILRMGRRCLVGNTKILLLNNKEKEIQDIKVGDIVLARSATGEKVYRRVTDFFENGLKNIFKITLANGMYVECTSNHPLLTFKHGKFRWLSKDLGLSVGDQVVVNDRVLFGSSVIESIVCTGIMNTYDISVEIDHNFIANGIVTHNTGKCVTGDSLILQADGSALPIKTMLNEERGSCMALNTETMKLEQCYDITVKESGKQEVYNLILENGQTIKATANHPFLTKDGWKELETIHIGEAIYVVSYIDNKSKTKISLNVLYQHIDKFLKYGFVAEQIFTLNPNQIKIYIKEISQSNIIKADFLNTYKIIYLLDFLNIRYNIITVGKENILCMHKKDFESIIENKTTLKNIFKKKKIVTLQKVLSKEYAGIEETYDLSVPIYHNFIANGIVAHNSTIMAAEAVYLAVTKPRHRIIFISPFETQCASFFSIIDKLIDGSPIVPKRRSQRPYKIEFENGSYIRAFTANVKSGSKGSSIRGQEGDHICFAKGTNVNLTSNVVSNIEDLQVKNDILGFEEKPYQGCIEQILINKDKEVMEIETPLQKIKCTPEHPFTFNGQEVPAKDAEFIYTDQSFRQMSFEKHLVEARLIGFVLNKFKMKNKKVIFDCTYENYEQIAHDLKYLGDQPNITFFNDTVSITSDLLFNLMIEQKNHPYIHNIYLLKIDVIKKMIFGDKRYRQEFLSGFLSRTASLFNISRVGDTLAPFLIYHDLSIKQKRYKLLKQILNKEGINESYLFIRNLEAFHYIKSSRKVSDIIAEIGTCYNKDNQKCINKYKIGRFLFKDKFDGNKRFKREIEEALKKISIFDNQYFVLPIISKKYLTEKEDVYNITTDSFARHRFHANGVVVHNCLDEMDFGMDGVVDQVVLPIYTGNPKSSITAASTPSGRRGTFYNWNMHPEIIQGRVFHVPSQMSPKWNEQSEITAKNSLTQNAYTHEILAEFGEEESGVFRKVDLDMCTIKTDHKTIEEYYASLKYDPANKYIMGVDWNKVYGVCIVVVEKNTTTGRYRVFAHQVVEKSEYTQLTGVDKIFEVHKAIPCNYIYVDEGYGETQYQMILKKANEDLSLGLKNKVFSINSSANMSYYDPEQKKAVITKIKPYMVNNMQKIIEKNSIDIHYLEAKEKKLLDQLGKYNVKITPGGVPVYIGYDHSLDPLMLAMLGYDMNFSNAKIEHVPPVAMSLATKMAVQAKNDNNSYRERLRLKASLRGNSRGGF